MCLYEGGREEGGREGAYLGDQVVEAVEEGFDLPLDGVGHTELGRERGREGGRESECEDSANMRKEGR